MDEWDFHAKGDLQCEACIIGAQPCTSCPGLVHTHLNEELDIVQSKCDQCARDVAPELPE